MYLVDISFSLILLYNMYLKRCYTVYSTQYRDCNLGVEETLSHISLEEILLFMLRLGALIPTGCPLMLWTLCFLQFLGLKSTLVIFVNSTKFLFQKCHTFLNLINIWLKYGPLNVGYLICKSTFLYVNLSLNISLKRNLWNQNKTKKHSTDLINLYQNMV